MTKGVMSPCGCELIGLRIAIPCDNCLVLWIENEWLSPLANDDEVRKQAERLTSKQQKELQGHLRNHQKAGRLKWVDHTHPRSLFIEMLELGDGSQ